MGCDENRMSIDLAAAVFVAVSILKAFKTEDLSRKLEVNYVKFQFRGGLLVPTGRHLVKLPDPLALLSNPSISVIHFPIIGGAIVSRLIKLWTPEDCQRVILFWMHLCFFCECFSTKTHTPCASSIDDVALSLRVS
ncbi:hypothetical protein Tco_1401730 [Tanacetum coccineum]